MKHLLLLVLCINSINAVDNSTQQNTSAAANDVLKSLTILSQQQINLQFIGTNTNTRPKTPELNESQSIKVKNENTDKTTIAPMSIYRNS